MAYDYKPRQVNNWDFAAQTAYYREAYMHQQQETAYWKGVARMAERSRQEVAA